MIDKKKSIEYWDNVAENWKYMTYDKEGKSLIFPSSQIRQEIVVKEIKKYFIGDAKILDIGCADGSLVIELIKNGYINVKGIDNSSKMITEAKIQLKKSGYQQKNVFFVADADSYKTEEKFDCIIALGLIEYVKDLNHFFSCICELLNENGIAYIESKNKLFNVFSSNEYTKKSDMNKLIKELDEIEHFSPHKCEEVITETFINIGKNLESRIEPKKRKIDCKKYPFELPQYTPMELISYFDVNLLKPVKVIYYHCHPFPLRYKNEFPELYDELSVMMQPLGYTSIGASISSAFVMVIKKWM